MIFFHVAVSDHIHLSVSSSTFITVLDKVLFMPPTLLELEGHIAFESFIHLSFLAYSQEPLQIGSKNFIHGIGMENKWSIFFFFFFASDL